MKTSNHLILYTLFFFSGCTALIYQIIWQRMLFTLFGVDLQSVTIIVSVFMFGLGLGGLWGGYISDYFTTSLLYLYASIELGIGIFGFCSPELINWVGNATLTCNNFVTGIMTFFILAIPTLLMGATFPILVTHLNKSSQPIGSAVGDLYFVNTLGAALGAYLSGFILLKMMDTVSIIDVTAFGNIFIACVALIFFRSPSIPYRVRHPKRTVILRLLFSRRISSKDRDISRRSFGLKSRPQDDTPTQPFFGRCI